MLLDVNRTQHVPSKPCTTFRCFKAGSHFHRLKAISERARSTKHFMAIRAPLGAYSLLSNLFKLFRISLISLKLPKVRHRNSL